MGILANTVSLCHYRINGDVPSGDITTWVGERLAGRGFRSIDNSAEEVSVGWVHLDDSQASDFGEEASFRRDNYFVFTLRRDQRRVPAALQRAHYELAVRAFLSANPGLARVPKLKREELRELVQGSLLARTLPAPAVYDAVWDSSSGILTFTSLSPKITEIFESCFKQTFEGLTLTPLYPMARAETVVAPELLPQLQSANQASANGVLEQIRDNRWLGEELLLWLLYRTLNASSEYAVCRPGPAGDGEVFTAYVNDRLLLQGEGAGGSQKLTVTGPQDSFREVRVALQGGKLLREGVICFEQQENLWRFNLKGELFSFASFKAPPVHLERDDVTDPVREREAIFYERMHLLGEGLQLFDSVLATYLRERLTGNWGEVQRRIDVWLNEE